MPRRPFPAALLIAVRRRPRGGRRRLSRRRERPVAREPVVDAGRLRRGGGSRARGAPQRAEARAGWRLLLFACACWLLGQAWWDLYSLSAIPPSPNPGDLFWLLFAVLTAAGVLRLAQGAERGRTVSALELAPIIVAVCTLLIALLWDDVRASDLSILGQITRWRTPRFYVSAALLMIQAVSPAPWTCRATRGCAPCSSGS